MEKLEPAEIQALQWFSNLELEDPLTGCHLIVSETPSSLAEEIESTFGLFEIHVRTIQVATASLAALLDGEEEPERVVILSGLESLTDQDLEFLDLRRTQLTTVFPMLVICTSTEGLQHLARRAPNLLSFLADTTSTWVDSRDDEGAQAYRESELARLRETWGLSDAEVVERAESSTLPPELRAEPDIYLWLALLGRGHLFERWRSADAD